MCRFCDLLSIKGEEGHRKLMKQMWKDPDIRPLLLELQQAGAELSAKIWLMERKNV